MVEDRLLDEESLSVVEENLEQEQQQPSSWNSTELDGLRSQGEKEEEMREVEERDEEEQPLSWGAMEVDEVETGGEENASGVVEERIEETPPVGDPIKTSTDEEIGAIAFSDEEEEGTRRAKGKRDSGQHRAEQDPASPTAIPPLTNHTRTRSSSSHHRPPPPKVSLKPNRKRRTLINLNHSAPPNLPSFSPSLPTIAASSSPSSSQHHQSHPLTNSTEPQQQDPSFSSNIQDSSSSSTRPRERVPGRPWKRPASTGSIEPVQV